MIEQVRAGALVSYNGTQGTVFMVIEDDCNCRGGDLFVIKFENGAEEGLRRQQFEVLSLSPDPGRV